MADMAAAPTVLAPMPLYYGLPYLRLRRWVTYYLDRIDGHYAIYTHLSAGRGFTHHVYLLVHVPSDTDLATGTNLNDLAKIADVHTDTLTAGRPAPAPEDYPALIAGRKGRRWAPALPAPDTARPELAFVPRREG